MLTIKALKCSSTDIFSFISPLLLIGVMLSIIPWYVVFFSLLFQMFTLNRREAVIVLLLILPQAIGILTRYVNFIIPGSLITVTLAFILSYKDFFLLKDRAIWSSLFYIFFTIFSFFLFYLLGGATELGTDRMRTMLTTTFFSIWPFLLLSKCDNISSDKLSNSYLLGSILFLSMGFSLLNYGKPTGLFDFNTFRYSTSLLLHSDTMLVSYHIPGMMAATAIAFRISHKSRFSSLFDVIFLASSLWVVLVSGARQAVVAALILMFFWILLKKGRKIKISAVLVAVLILLISLYALSNVQSDALQESLGKSDSIVNNLNRNFDFAVEQFINHPLVGIGFGHYFNPVSEEIYPHNIFLELLSEQGIIGFLYVTLIVLIFSISNKITIFKRLPNSSLALLILLPYFITALISGDMGGNIKIFIAFFFFYNRYL